MGVITTQWRSRPDMQSVWLLSSSYPNGGIEEKLKVEGQREGQREGMEEQCD